MRRTEKKFMAELWGRPAASLSRRVRRQLPEVVVSLRAAASRGDRVAMTCLAYLIKVRLTPPLRRGEMVELIERAARLNEPAAQLQLSVVLKRRGRVRQSLRWLLRAAENALPEALFHYALALLALRRPRRREAEALLRRAHRFGHRDAAGWLAVTFGKTNWIRIAARQGDAHAIHLLSGAR
ncbi:MAG: hypothetical protein QM817_38525 [Archangium sp.]